MIDAVSIEERVEPSEEHVRRQLTLLAEDPFFRTSKRSVAFLRYVVEQTLAGSAHLLKERTIGVEVFGREPSYDTGSDHVVRTAASELRKRLAIYYVDERHRAELRIDLLPGSYVPLFCLPPAESEWTQDQHAILTGERAGPVEASTELAAVQPLVAMNGASARRMPPNIANSRKITRKLFYGAIIFGVLGAGAFLFSALHVDTPRTRFWRPVLRMKGPVLIAVGDVPKGPPSMASNENADMPPLPKPGDSNPPTVPFADTVTIANVASVLSQEGKQVILRRETSSSFSDLREQPVVLIGAFNNEWSLRLTRTMRFSLAMDTIKKVIYIRDRDHPENRQWSWSIEPHADDSNRVTSASLHDYALISRIVNSETGQVVVIIGGLYTYGTQAAGEFLSDPQLMSLTKSVPLDATKKNLQIVLETDVTQETPGPPRVVAVSSN